MMLLLLHFEADSLRIPFPRWAYPPVLQIGSSSKRYSNASPFAAAVELTNPARSLVSNLAPELLRSTQPAVALALY